MTTSASRLANTQNVDYRLRLGVREPASGALESLVSGSAGPARAIVAASQHLTTAVERLDAKMSEVIAALRGEVMRPLYGSTADVSEITGRSEAWVRQHGDRLGGWKSKSGRGGRWRFRLADVEERARALAPREPLTSPLTAPAPVVDTDRLSLTPRPRMPERCHDE